MIEGLVLKKNSTVFVVELSDGKTLDCVARKNLKCDGVFVGDHVEIENDVMVAVRKRKNRLVRPPVCNIDKMFIVVSPIPKPDFYMVDKMLLFCETKNIQPILCINKTDLDENFAQKVENIYQKNYKIVKISAKKQDVLSLKRQINGVCVLAGQSAVGKSSIINALKKQDVAKVDNFSKKTQKGKQTTRTVELYKFGEGKYLADTAGFSKLDETLLEIDFDKVKNYYPEFAPYAKECKYRTCNHNAGKDCGVNNAVKNGKISKERYQNYLKIFENIKTMKKF